MSIAKTTRRLLILLAAYYCIKVAVVQAEDELVPKVCDNVTTCVDCMETTGCGVWQPGVVGTGICADRCLIVDLSCYSSSYYTGKTSNEICQMVEDAKADAALCGRQDCCDTCVATVLSDGSTTCQWFPDFSACVSDSGMLEPGETTCT